MKKLPNLRNFIHSIRFRLVLWFTMILALVLFAFSAFVYLNHLRDIRGDAIFRLERRMSWIENALMGAQSQPVVLQEQDIFVLLDSSGTVVAQQGIESSDDVLALIKNAQQARQQGDSEPDEERVTAWVEERGANRTHYSFIVKSVFLAGRQGVAILGSPFDPYDLDKRLLATLLFGNALALAVAAAGGLWLADRAMRPVHTITQAARTISETDLNRRLNMKSKDELGELANTFDAMLARLQAAFERQRQFVADASHELRTPLTIVNLESSRALAAKRSPQEYQRALEVIHSENEFMAHLVNDLLILARMDSGQMQMEKVPLDLSDIALEAVERLASLAERSHVRLETGDLPEVTLNGDRQYLLQMLSNLIENGIKYTGGELRLVRVETGQEGGTAWARVTDSGAGIAPEHLPHLFDRFYRVDKARAREDDETPGGNGLGLSIVQWIAQAHGGEVRVESTVGVGTTFEVRFTLC